MLTHLSSLSNKLDSLGLLKAANDVDFLLKEASNRSDLQPKYKRYNMIIIAMNKIREKISNLLGSKYAFSKKNLEKIKQLNAKLDLLQIELDNTRFNDEDIWNPSESPSPYYYDQSEADHFNDMIRAEELADEESEMPE